ncbi:hypothetical protein HR11_08510 [Porphyromonas macacae]|uniref:Uncharacterized protein n=1 Tax=Porphyromonas macacae TaxID=28115 RepID=A0A379E6U0_9PORP|nr:hypothetical protein [Porphyromonas macacae]KGN98564.1 hypothetical protein HR11_08510 [Porphyromonas macacae]SUB88408.1 Uncharacterised protein [Porphyromonas macacae]
MAYRRPLSNMQIFCIICLWLILIIYILMNAVLDGPTVVMLILASVLLAYPVVKSIRQRRR